MIYQVQMEFVPGNPQIWVARLNPDDPIYEYDTFQEALEKTVELQKDDPTGRRYRVVNFDVE